MDVSIAQTLSPRVEEAIKKVLGSESDELDGPSFDAIDFVNRKFPDERSLESLDRTISDYDYEIKTLDSSIFETVREQSTAGQVAAKDIADAKDSIGDLHAKIVEIKKKAEASEQMVQEICRDIKQLDVAKRHLTNTIMTIARLKTLTSAVQQLQTHAARRAYDEAAPLLEASIQLFTHFTEYSRLPKVSELAIAVEAIRNELKEAITEHFDILLDTATPTDMNFETSAPKRGGVGDPDAGVETKVLTLDDLKARAGEGVDGARALSDDNIATLQAACECIDALGPTVRKAILKSFNRKQLKPYGRLFGRGSELGDALESIEKRYAWFRKSLRDLDDKYGRVLPKRWRVQHRLCIEFCEASRLDIERILSSFDPPTAVPAEPLLRALLKTLAFEKEMAKKFEADLSKVGTIDDETLGGGRGRFAEGHHEGGEDEEDGEAADRLDEAAPLYNDKGELVDPSTAEGIRLKYKRKKEFEERKVKEAERRAQRAQQRQLLAQLAGAEPATLGNRAGASPSKGGSIAAIGRASLDEEITALPKIATPGEGLISSCFKPYMTSYVRFERLNIDNIVSQTTVEDMSATDGSSAAASILRSAAQLFAQARNSVMRCVQLNTGQTLYELCGEIRESLMAYSANLSERLPKPSGPQLLRGETYAVSDAEGPGLVDTLCLIINTSEYCAETVPKFVESVQKVLDAQYKDHVGMDNVQEAFYSLTAAALNRLSGLVACMLDTGFTRLMKAEWTKLADVGDQSPYVADIARGLKLSFPVAKKRLDDGLYRNFCTKFAAVFTPRYLDAIFKSEKIGETGAQQLLLDAQEIKKLLLSAPLMRPASDKFMTALVKHRTGGPAPDVADVDDDDRAPGSEEASEVPSAPPMYIKFVNKEMPPIELYLKLVATPRERFVDTVKALWTNATEKDVTRLMNLKNLPKKEQSEILVSLGLAKSTTFAGLGVPLTMGAGIGSFAGMGGMGGMTGSTAGGAAAAGRSEAGGANPFGASTGGAAATTETKSSGGLASTLGSGINLTGGMGGMNMGNMGKLFSGSNLGLGKSKK